MKVAIQEMTKRPFELTGPRKPIPVRQRMGINMQLNPGRLGAVPISSYGVCMSGYYLGVHELFHFLVH